MKDRGFSILEMILAVACAAALALMTAQYLPSFFGFLRHLTAGETLNLQAQQCANLISRQLSNALAGTIVISSAGPGAAPNSRITFRTADQTAIEIVWSSSPANSVHLRTTNPNSGITQDHIMASNVASLMFFFADFRDPSVIHFTIQLQAPYEASTKNPMASALIANQIVQTVMPH